MRKTKTGKTKTRTTTTASSSPSARGGRPEGGPLRPGSGPDACVGDAARLAVGVLEDVADCGAGTCPDPACGCDAGLGHADGCRFAAFLRHLPIPRARRPRARGVRFEAAGGSGLPSLVVELDDGRTVSAPVGWFPRLAHGTPYERVRWELIARGGGIHWPLLDEDISVEGLLAGRRSGECGASVAKWKKWLAAERETARLAAARPKRKARVARPGAGGDWIYGNPMKPGYGMAKRRGRKAKKS